MAINFQKKASTNVFLTPSGDSQLDEISNK